MRTIQVIGGNLWQVAARELGDATQASRIALLNGLSDPVLPAGVLLALKLPAVDPNAGGGLFPQ
jgi:nucleoid-associated protein YgaU